MEKEDESSDDEPVDGFVLLLLLLLLLLLSRMPCCVLLTLCMKLSSLSPLSPSSSHSCTERLGFIKYVYLIRIRSAGAEDEGEEAGEGDADSATVSAGACRRGVIGVAVTARERACEKLNCMFSVELEGRRVLLAVVAAAGAGPALEAVAGRDTGADALAPCCACSSSEFGGGYEQAKYANLFELGPNG